MTHRLLADALVLLHLAFVAFVVLGALLVRYRRWIAALHLPAAAWGAWIEFSGGICPLTPWENALRQRAGQAGYRSGFVEHYLMPLLYPPGLDADLQWLLGAAVIAINLLAYGWALTSRRRRP